jgi:hypothetical protein
MARMRRLMKDQRTLKIRISIEPSATEPVDPSDSMYQGIVFISFVCMATVFVRCCVQQSAGRVGSSDRLGSDGLSGCDGGI